MRMGCSDADITSIKEGLKEALGKTILAVLSFKDFAVCFSWFGSTLHMMRQVPGSYLNLMVCKGICHLLLSFSRLD